MSCFNCDLSKMSKDEVLKCLKERSWYWYNEMKKGGSWWYVKRCKKNSEDFCYLYRSFKTINNL